MLTRFPTILDLTYISGRETVCGCRYDILTAVTTNSTRVEAGSNTSTVTLRVVRGDEMGLKKAAP
jgi:hypothetical protein